MAKDYAAAFYNSREWEACRESYMRFKFYICERCGRQGKIVHHKRYITPETIGSPEVTLNWDNLECLCQNCHNREHHGEPDGLRDGLAFDENGQLVQRNPPHK